MQAGAGHSREYHTMAQYMFQTPSTVGSLWLMTSEARLNRMEHELMGFIKAAEGQMDASPVETICVPIPHESDGSLEMEMKEKGFNVAYMPV